MWGGACVDARAVRAIEPKLVLDSIIMNYRSHHARAVRYLYQSRKIVTYRIVDAR